MNSLPKILALGWIELAGGALFVAFWLISAVAGKLGKKAEEAERLKKQNQRSRTPPSRPGQPRPLPPVLPSREALANAELQRREQANAELREKFAHQQTQATPPPMPRPQQSMRTDPAREQQEQAADRRQKATKAQAKKKEQAVRKQIALRELQELATQKSARNTERAVIADEDAANLPFSSAGSEAGTSTDSKHETVTSADARSIRKWLTPMTLKQQYMLTEILAPPISLRP